MAAKRKLLVVAGAGSSLDFGMPSVWEVGELLRKGAQEHFALAETPAENLYGYLHDGVACYWRESYGPILILESPISRISST